MTVGYLVTEEILVDNLVEKGEDAKMAHQVTENLGDHYVRSISCGDYYTTAIVDLNPRNLLLWKFLRMERRYLTRLIMFSDYYAKNIFQDLGKYFGGKNGR